MKLQKFMSNAVIRLLVDLINYFRAATSCNVGSLIVGDNENLCANFWWQTHATSERIYHVSTASSLTIRIRKSKKKEKGVKYFMQTLMNLIWQSINGKDCRFSIGTFGKKKYKIKNILASNHFFNNFLPHKESNPLSLDRIASCFPLKFIF